MFVNLEFEKENLNRAPQEDNDRCFVINVDVKTILPPLESNNLILYLILFISVFNHQIQSRNEIWLILYNLKCRMQDIDSVIYFTETLPRILQRHIEKFNLALAHQIDENQHIVRFMVARHLEDDRAELELLRKIVEYLLKILLPENYALSDEFIYLIREVLTNHVFFNLIDYLCDPYFINHRIITHGSIVGPVATSLDANLINDYNSTINRQQQTSNLNDDDNDSEKFEDITDSIYDLVCEIFSLKKAQHWLRRTVIQLFQVVFGKTINKQLKDGVLQLTSDELIMNQLIKFRDSFWPDGILDETSAIVSEDDKKLTYLLAKQYLINNIPDVFVNLIGQQNAKKGFLKVFEALQNKKANKQLFYVSMV